MTSGTAVYVIHHNKYLSGSLKEKHAIGEFTGWTIEFEDPVGKWLGLWGDQYIIEKASLSKLEQALYGDN